MRYDIRKNWATSLGLIKAKPVIILPFIIIAFFEALALELLYFSTRWPLSLIANPIIIKFFGEPYLHYPGNLIMLSKLISYSRMLIYVCMGVFLIAISINIFKNTKEDLPIKANALIKNALKKYASFIVYGIIVILLTILIKNVDTAIFNFTVRKLLPGLSKFYLIGLSLLIFLSNIVLQVFLISAIPYMILQKTPMPKALLKSVVLGLRNFISLFMLIVIPYLVYLPIALLKSVSFIIVEKTFPEINIIIIAAGIVITTIFADSFIFVSIAQFLSDKEGVSK